MPLDYSIWTAIENKMDKTSPNNKVTESKADFLQRLERAARTLPRGFVRKTIARMKGNIQGVIAARGWHSKTD